MGFGRGTGSAIPWTISLRQGDSLQSSGLLSHLPDLPAVKEVALFGPLLGSVRSSDLDKKGARSCLPPPVSVLADRWLRRNHTHASGPQRGSKDEEKRVRVNPCSEVWNQ
ncbi:hypothetical protein SRHO_G00105330 [Serrasalmus rhombeus]